QTRDGGYAISGYTTSFGKNYFNMYIVKLDSNASLQWTKVISDTIKYEYLYGNSIVSTKDGGLAIVGSENNAGGGGVYFVKLDYSGNLGWVKVYLSNYGWALPYSVIQNTDGGYAITGTN